MYINVISSRFRVMHIAHLMTIHTIEVHSSCKGKNKIILEIKPCGLGSRIRDMKAFWYKTEIIYFVRWCWLCVIVWFTLTLNFLYLKLKTDSFNVCFKKIWTNCSSDTILQFVQVFLKQMLLVYYRAERRGFFDLTSF